MLNLPYHRLSTHHKGVRVRHLDKIRHPLDPGVFDTHLAIVRARQALRQNGVDRTGSGNNPEGEIHRSQRTRHTAFASPQLLPCGAVQPLVTRHITPLIHDLAPLVRRRQHHHASQPGNAVIGQVVADQNPPQRVGDKMYCLHRLPVTARDTLLYRHHRQTINGFLPGRVADIHHAITAGGQRFLQIIH